jgi:hypothetical protein
MPSYSAKAEYPVIIALHENIERSGILGHPVKPDDDGCE